MNIKTIKTLSLGLFAHLLAISVVLAHAHAGDIAKHSGPDASMTIVKTSGDLNAKVVNDLHTHIDKTSLKNVMKSAGDTATVGRRRDVRPSLFEEQLSLFDRWIA